MAPEEVVAARNVRPPLTRPSDFDAFWASTLAELDRVPVGYRVGTVTRAPDNLTLEPVRFRSLGDVDIQGYLLSPAGAPGDSHAWSQPRPLVITTHGYGGACNPAVEARHVRDFDLFCFDVRGHGRSRDAAPADPHGYILTGLCSPETSILRGAICDYVRAADVASRLRRGLATRLVFHGRSFGGAMAFMAQAVRARAELLAVAVPTLGWAAGRRVLVNAGSGGEINDHLRRQPESETAVMRTLGYFDTVNFADRIRCTALVGVGMKDTIVPAETVYAIVNHMSPRPEVVELPVSHSVELDEARWQEFDERWTAQVRGLA